MGIYRSPLTLATLEAIFQRQGWHYQLIRGRLVSSFDGVLMVLSVDEEREIVLIEVPLVPGRGMQGYLEPAAEAEADAALFMTAANYQLALGAFSRDHHDGEIRYECNIPVLGTLLSDAQLKLAIIVAVSAVAAYAPTINELLTGRVPLWQALAQLDTNGGGTPPAMAV